MKSNLMKLLTGTSAIAMASFLSTAPIMAAESVTVDGQEYTSAYSTDTWSWDGANDLYLIHYQGQWIYVDGDVLITLIGENKIVDAGGGIYVENGDLTITGEEGSSLSVEVDDIGDGIAADGNVEINKAKVDVTTEDGDGIVGHEVKIKDSTVTIEAGTEDEDEVWDGIYAGATEDEAGSILIDNSNVKSTGSETSMRAESVIDWDDEGNLVILDKGTITWTDSALVNPENGKVAYDEEWGYAYITDAEGNNAKTTEFKATKQVAKRAVETSVSSDMSLYLAGAVVAVCGAGLVSKKRK